MAELADATVSNTVEGNLVRVQVPAPVPILVHIWCIACWDRTDTGGQADDLTDRIAAFAAEDLARAEQMPEGARMFATREFLPNLLAASGITDVRPGLDDVAIDGGPPVG